MRESSGKQNLRRQYVESTVTQWSERQGEQIMNTLHDQCVRGVVAKSDMGI